MATLLSNLPGLAYRCKNDKDWTMELVSDGCEALTGYKATELVGVGARTYNSLIHPDDRNRIWHEVQVALTQRLPFRLTYRILAADGREKWVWEQGVGVFSGVELEALEGFITDITELKEAERQYRDIFEGALEGMYRTTPQGRSLAANPALAKMLGYDSAEEFISAITDTAHQLWMEPDERARCMQLLEDHEVVRGFDCQLRRKDGTTVWVSINLRKVSPDEQTVYYEGFIEDITERKRVEGEKAKLEDRLRQAQKLESIGRLAGGVAHDFNNLLTVINGYSEFLLKRLKATDPLRSYANQIREAGERAASLTKQLLAFSRRQAIEPRVLDLNMTIRESAPMLRRLIGEDVVLKTQLEECLGQVLADPDQIHQVLMNLVVNARDAMPDGGRLDIATTNMELDEENAAIHPAATPGRYVLMTVTDTGNGMDATTRQRIFEPFFTTKEIGKGTGLGLSTVYGIIRQNGGWVDVSSEVGVGTSFEVYLPRIDACPVPDKHGSRAATGGGRETILVVEDQTTVRHFAGTALRQYGYHVVEASDGYEAMSLADQYAGEIQLLLTDVVMPGMNGKELSERLKGLRPNLKILFTSGYTADVIADRGVLDRGVAFLHKPFGPEELAAKVREMLADPSKPIVGS